MKTVYICCPASSYTGGPTLAHQLCYVLNQNGINAKMWYYCNPLKKNKIDPVHQNYKSLNNPYTLSNPIDSEDSVIVATESKTQLLWKYKKAHKFVWWMSVDNYYMNMVSLFDILKMKYRGFKPTLEYCKKYKNKKKYQAFRQSGVLHLVQSEYAREFLLSEGIESDNIFSLTDYLEEEILNSANKNAGERSNNTVLYNPKKGFEFTQKIIASSTDLDWKPLINMTKAEVSNALLTSRLYIDFGNHPGKDRFPREAAICGCCIITGKRGAAKNDIDIQIDQKYKFDDVEENIDKIVSTIREILSNYDTITKDFDAYREKIKKEKDAFVSEALSIFSPFKD